MSALEIIEKTMNASGLDSVQTQDARDVIEALTAAGYRILAPGEVDRETVERCAEIADKRTIDALVAALEEAEAALRRRKQDYKHE